VVLRFVPALLLFLGATILPVVDWNVAEPDYRWSFPEDHWAHRSYRTEWWYFTGHLASIDNPERVFGYQFTVFRIGLLTERPPFDSDWSAGNLIMGHAAVTDPLEQEHRFSELLYREVPLLGEFRPFPAPVIAWVRGPVGTAAQWQLEWNGSSFDFSMQDDEKGMAFRLSTTPTKPLVLQGPNGYSRKGDAPGAASLYYSFTRLKTEGTLRLEEKSFEVKGESWMDKEISSSQLSESQVGWDWFSLQLRDDRELMLYMLRRKDGSADFRHATLVSPSGKPRYLGASEWSVRSVESWESEASGAVYPSRWRVTVPAEGLAIEVRPILADQENRSQLPGGVHYWEGAVEVFDASGKRLGRGYVELTGYGDDNRPPV
jgi:predicted secreted hydrolase